MFLNCGLSLFQNGGLDVIFMFDYNNMMQRGEDQKNKPSKFKQGQLSLGLRKQFFDAKFVYSQQQISSPSAFFTDLSKEFPSQLHGFTLPDIQLIHAFACQVMRQAAISLSLPISTLIVAQSLFHFFYSRKSFLDHDIRDIMMGCMYLACKSEETLKNSYEITIVFDYLFKVYEGDKKLVAIEIGSTQYNHIKNKTIMKAQLDLLFQLGFEVYRLLDIPHRYFGLFLALFEKHPKYSLICQAAWKRLNDCYFTTACLHYPHNIIASSALYMAMRQCQVNFPEIPWWTLMQSYREVMENIEVMVLRLQENSKNITFQNVSTRLKEVSETYGIVNGFPVPYYRKIMLQNRGKFRITKEAQQNFVQPNPNTFVNLSQLQDEKTQRKIMKVKQPEESIQINQEQVKKQKEVKEEKQIQLKKVTIDKKNLFESINKKLQKHEAALNKPVKESSESSEQQVMIAELKKKIQMNKEAKMQAKE